MADNKHGNPFESISIAPADEQQAGEAPAADGLDEPPDAERQGQGPLEGPHFPRQKDATSTGRLKWLLWLAAAVLAIYLLAGYLLVPYLCRTVLARKLSVMLERSVTVGAAAFSPLTLTLTLDNGIIGPRLTNPEDNIDPIFSFGRFEVDIEASSLLKMGLICRQVRLDRFFLHAVRQPDASYNLTELLPPLSPSQPEGADAGRSRGFAAMPGRFSLNNISLTNGRLIFDDRPAAATHTIEEINLALPVLSNFSYQVAEYIRPEFSAKINGSPVFITGETAVSGQGVETRLKLKLTAIDLPAYLAYLPAGGTLSLAGGRAELDAECLFSTQRSGPQRLQVSGAVKVTDLRVVEAGTKEVVVLPELIANGAFMPLAGRLHLTEVTALRPELNLERTAPGGLNLAVGGLLAHGGLTLDRLRVSDAKVNFIDRTMVPRHAETWTVSQATIEDYAVESEQGQENRPAAFNLQAEKNAGVEKSSIKAEGTILAKPWQVQGTLEIAGISLPDYHPYWAGLLAADSPLQDLKGRLTATGDFSWPADSAGKPGLRFAQATGTLQNLTVTAMEQQVLAIPSLSFTEASLDLAGRRLDFGKIRAEEGGLLLGLAPRPEMNPPAAIDAGQGPPPAVAAGEKAGWAVGLKALNFDRLAVRLPRAPAASGATPAAEDPAAQPAVIRLSEMALQFSEPAEAQEQTSPGHQLTGSAVVNGSGRLQCEGIAGFAAVPFSATLNCQLDALELAAVAELLPAGFANRLASGRLRAEGELKLPEFSFAGTAAILDFKSKGTAKGPDGEQEIVRWGTAEAHNLRYTSQPPGLSAERIVVHGPRLLWDLQPQANAGTNLAAELLGLLPPPAAEHNGMKRSVGAIDLAEAELTIFDQNLTPAYQARISAISGSLTRGTGQQAGVSSQLVLQGRYNGAAPIQADCRLEDLGPGPAGECKIKATGVDLVPLSPYLAPHLGCEIAAGKLDLLADYELAQGDAVVATHLEVSDFAPGQGRGLDQLEMVTALLTDQDNKMTLDIPVSGRLDDPAFSIRAGLLKALRNLLLKTPVAPFATLGPLIRAEAPQAAATQDLDKIFFPAGSAELTPEGRKKLQILAIIAQRRPRLVLEATGYADARLDREALIAVRKQSPEYLRAMEEARQSEAAIKTYGKEEAAGAGRRPASRPPDDTGKRVIPITITDRQLLDLAASRGRKLQQYLVEEAGVDLRQVSADQESRLIPADTPGRPGNRADFRLRALKIEE